MHDSRKKKIIANSVFLSSVGHHSSDFDAGSLVQWCFCAGSERGGAVFVFGSIFFRSIFNASSGAVDDSVVRLVFDSHERASEKEEHRNYGGAYEAEDGVSTIAAYA
jgi:hypothetical protein